MDKTRFLGAVFTVLTLASTSVQAVPMLEYSGTDIIGVTGVIVGGDTYNATFIDGTFGDAFSSDPTIVYGDTFSDDATTALYNFLVSIDTSTYQADDFLGCETANCYLVTVDQYTTTAAGPSVDVHNDMPAGIGITLVGIDPTIDYDSTSFVSWTNVGAVAEPPIALLMASGLIVFGMTGMKRRA